MTTNQAESIDPKIIEELRVLALDDSMRAANYGHSLNPFSTFGSRTLWQKGWDGIRPANLTDTSIEWRYWERGRQARGIEREMGEQLSKHGAERLPAMGHFEKASVNGYTAIKTQITVANGAFHWARSAIGKMPSGDKFSWLMGILEGHNIEATVFSGTNLSGHTNEQQLRAAFKVMDPAIGYWVKEPQLEAVIANYADGKLGFHMSGLYCAQTPSQIEAFLERANSEQESKKVIESPRG